MNASDVLGLYRLGDGRYFWRANASDVLGLFNDSFVYSFSIDTANSTVDLNGPSDAGSYASGSTISFNWTANDTIDTSLDCNLTIDSSVNQSTVASANGSVVNRSITGFSAAAHTWSVFCRDDASNSINSSQRTFTITSANSAPYNKTGIFINSTNGLNRTIDAINVSTRIVDDDGNAINVTVYWYNNSRLHIVNMYNNSYANATNFTAVLLPGNLTQGHNWTAGFILSDGAASSGQVNITINVTIVNSIPYNLTALILNGTTGLNRSNETIFVRTTLFDLDISDGMNVTVTWYNASRPHATFLYNSSYANGTLFIANLTAGNTTRGHNWSVQLQINDGRSNFVSTGFLPGGNSSISETSRSPGIVSASVRGIGVAVILKR